MRKPREIEANIEVRGGSVHRRDHSLGTVNTQNYVGLTYTIAPADRLVKMARFPDHGHKTFKTYVSASTMGT